MDFRIKDKVIFLVLFHLFFSTASQELNVMSFNVRYGTANDGINSWENRKEFVHETIKREKYDFIGVQEALGFQIAFIKEKMDGYSVFFRGREKDPTKGESCGIFYSDSWEIDTEESGTFWLSENPEKPASKSWDASLPRIATWARFTNKENGGSVYIYNTHFDHVGQIARENSSKTIMKHISERPYDVPVVFLGDFNASEKNNAIKIIKKGIPNGPVFFDPWNMLNPDSKERGTFNSWENRKDGAKIDYIFVLEGTKVLDAQILRGTFNGRNSSDHYPVTAKLIMDSSFKNYSIQSE